MFINVKRHVKSAKLSLASVIKVIMSIKAKIGDIWEARNGSGNWDFKFHVESISGKTAVMKSPSGDTSKVGIDFVTMDSWRLVKRKGKKTLCKKCNNVYV